MNDLFLFLGIIFFLFVVWLYNGGPHNPFSFSGPYITPITNVDQSQQGYGPSANTYYRSANSFFGIGTKDADGIPAADQSPYAGAVRLNGGDLSATEPRQEYLTLRSSSDAPVSITGWQLVSTKTGAHAAIPSGVQIADINSKESAIVLSDGQEAIVSTGSSPYEDAFRETSCTGYLDRNGHLSPSLSNRCPSPTDELGSFYSGNATRYDQCLDYVESLRSCSAPDEDAPSSVPASCRTFVDGRLNYSGCVSGHRSDSDFYSDTWRVFLGSSKELWRSSNDTIRLLDANGKVVDQYSY